MYWIKGNIVVLGYGYFFDYCVSLKLILFTLAGPKGDIGRAEKSLKGQNATLEYYNKYYIQRNVFLLFCTN